MPIRRTKPGKETSERQRNIDSLPTRDPGSQKWRTFVIYGPAGTGKTTLLGTFPKPLLVLDVNDRGDESLSGLRDTEVMDIRNLDDMEDALSFLRTHPKDFASCGIDTITQLQEIAMHELVPQKGTKLLGDWGSIKKQDWGKISGRMKTLITEFRDLPMNVAFLAQHRLFNLTDDEEEVGLDVDPEIGPRLMPSVASHLNAAVGIIGNTFKRKRNNKEGKTKVEYCMRLGPNPIYITKVRKAKSIDLPEFLRDPTYEDIIDVIKGAY